MHILCPHCRNPIEVVKLTPREEVACPSCGSSFCLETESTTGWARSGERLGKFELLDTVGQGAFGTVYKARDPELDRTVAIKVPRAGNLAGPQELDRFLREARTVAQLRHPSIVTVHEVGQSEGVPYLVSDFVQGVTLADLLSARRPGFREAAELVAAVADALHFAHERGVVHRDVKPSNIMIGEDGRPVVDGLRTGQTRRRRDHHDGRGPGARHAGLHEPGTSPRRCSPGGWPLATCTSLGVILYELLTGELPFRGNKRMLLHQVLHDEPRRPRSLNDHIPRNLETICLKAMAKEPGRRYATARELADDLRRWLQDEPILARPVGRVERAVQWVRRNPTVAASLTGVAAALLVGTAVSVFFGVDANLQANQARQDKAAAVNANASLETANANLETANTSLSVALEDVKKSKHNLEGSMVRSWPLPLSSKSGPLSEQEIEVLTELAAHRGEPVAIRFVEEALKEPNYLRRLGTRSEYALHATVGLDTRKHAEMERILGERLSGQEVTLEERTDLSLSLAALGDLDSRYARQAIATLTQAMTKTNDPNALQFLAQGMSAGAARLEPKEAAEGAATLTQAMTKTTDPNALQFLAQGLSAVAARLEPKEASRVSAEAAATLTQAMTKTTDPNALVFLAQGLSEVGPRLEPKEAAEVAATLTQAITKTTYLANLLCLAQGLSAVTARLEPKEAAATRSPRP